MNFKEKYCLTSEKDKLENKDKIVLDDKDYLLIDAMYKVANELRRRK